MRVRTFANAALLVAALAAGGCAVISSDETAEALRANADVRYGFTTAAAPGAACMNAAKMLSWCATGPNYHYRCNIAADDSKAELSGVFEAVYRAEFLVLVDFKKAPGGGATATSYQRASMLVRDYGPMIDRFLAGTGECKDMK
jgi:hypothetical protein